MKQIFSSLMLMMLCVGTLTLAINVQPAKSAKPIVVPDDYKTIQDAVNAANSGDTIYVRNGIYREHIDINKTVTLRGESNENTTLESLEISITASNVTVENFLILPQSSYVIMIDGRDTNCSGNTVRNNVLLDTDNIGCEMLDILNSERNTISGNQIVMEGGKDSGIALEFQANHNIIDNNTVMGGWTDLFCDFSEGYNVFSNNYAAGQTRDPSLPEVGAMFTAYTSGIIVKGNTFINNDIGFSAPDSQAGVSLYHNNFINNTQQALVSPGNTIVCDNGYPSGGNYWSDYSGKDGYSGPFQNETGGDGIGDTPYVIASNNKDSYPLMNLWIPIPGDINGDGSVTLQDLMLLAQAYGSKPGDLRWNLNADINRNDVVGLIDLVILAQHYGQHNP